MSKGAEKAFHLLVDYENVQQIELSNLDAEVSITIFVGSAQKTVPFELVEAMQRLGERATWVKVEGNGKNALDFHIAYYLGCLLTQSPQRPCVILSKDCGFDTLVRHLNTRGHRCRRVESVVALLPQVGVEQEQRYQLLLQRLAKSPEKGLPGSRTALTQHVAAMFQKKLAEAEVTRLVERLFTERKVTETETKLVYHL